MRNVPELRFDGFVGEWEEHNLSEFISVYRGLTYSPKDITNNISDTFVIRSSNVKNNSIIDADNVYVNPSIVNTENVKNGDIILVVRNGSRSLIGKHAAITKDMPNTVIGAFMSGVRARTPDFINALFDTSKFDKNIRKNLGATINQITNKNISEMKFFFTDIEEQEKIGVLFKKLDALIEVQEGKVSKLEDFKKSMLQKMFPKKGELVPEFRFDGFDGEWKSSKLKHIGIVKSGVGFPEKFQGGISGIPFFKVSDMNLGSNNIIMKNAQNYVSESDIITNKWNVITDRPAIIFAKVGAAIFLERKRIVTEDFLIDNNMMAFISKVKSNLYFLKVFLDTTRLAKYAQSGALPSYNANDIYSIPINLPSLEEQEKIGNFFKNLDTQIENEEKLLDSYKNMKKSLLQKMFV